MYVDATIKPIVLITAPAHPILSKQLAAAGFEVIDMPDCSIESLQNLMPLIHGLVVTTRLKIDKQLLSQADNLQWIGRLGSGMELIDVKYAKEKGIVCQSTPEGNCNAVAEHALGMLLAVNNSLLKSSMEVKEGKCIRDANRGFELCGKTIGIIGYGNTGSAFARLLSGFDVEILVHDKFKSGFSEGKIKGVNLADILDKSNVISFHVPLDDSTFHLANADFFNSVRQNPIIINTSRGSVIDTKQLIEALKNNKVSGAVLDVLENEQLSSYNLHEKEQIDFLNAHPKVMITPHIAGYSHEAFYKMSKILLDKLGF